MRHKPPAKKNLRFKFLPLLLLLVLLITPFVLLSQSKWNGKGSFKIALTSRSGEVFIAAFENSPKQIEISELDETDTIESAHGLGKWKLGSLWKLGEQEKIGGDNLVRDSLVQSVGVPIEGVWQINNTNSFTKTSLTLALFRGSGDLSLATRLKLAAFIFSSPILTKEVTSLDFNREILADPEQGVVTIVDKTGQSYKYINSVTRIIESLGGRVLNISNVAPENGTCEVQGSNDFVSKLASVLNCKHVKGDASVLTIYSQFLDRF